MEEHDRPATRGAPDADTRQLRDLAVQGRTGEAQGLVCGAPLLDLAGGPGVVHEGSGVRLLVARGDEELRVGRRQLARFDQQAAGGG